MKEGKIVQSGTFEEIEKGPHYQNIFTRTDGAKHSRANGAEESQSHSSFESNAK